MPRIPPQSEPVNYKELCKRLEIVLRQQESRKRRTRSLKQQEASSPSKQRDSPDTKDEAPPPPTVLPTRPVSFLPLTDTSQPRSAQSSRLSPHMTQASNRTSVQPAPERLDVFGTPLANDLQGVGEAARLGARSSSRPSTSWKAERHSRLASKEEEEGVGLNIYGPEQRPKSLCNTNIGNEPSIIITKGPGIVKQDSLRQVQAVAQPVQIVNQNETVPMAAPISAIHDQVHAIPLNAPTEPVLPDGPDMSMSSLSSATTVVPAHSASSSKSERKSWNPKTLIARLKERRVSSDKTSITILEQPSPIAEPVHEIIVEPSSPIQPNMSISNRTTPTWERPILRQHASACEPFRFNEYRFSGLSDRSSARASEPTGCSQYSDIDSGLGMSDSGSNAGTEEMPTLMPGAEKQPDWNKVESPIKSKRHSFVPFQGRTTVESGSPVKRAYKESALRKEVPLQERFDFNPDPSLNLQEVPPNEEGVIVNHALNDEPVIFVPPPPPLPQLHQARSVPDFSTKGNAIRQTKKGLEKRRTFTSLQKEYEVSSSDKPPKRNTISHRSSDAESIRSTRPPSRSQPIIVKGFYHQPLPQSSVYRSPTKSSATNNSTPTSKTHSKPASVTGLQATSNILIVPNPPEVPADEMAHMTAQSVAFLREQEKRLIRRSTMQLAQAHVQVMQRAFDEKGEIGVAISPVPPATLKNEKQIAVAPAGMAYNIQYPTAHRVQSPRPATSSRGSRRATVTSPPRAASLSSPKPATGKTFSRNVLPGTVSMVDLNKLGAKVGAHSCCEDPKQQKKKKKWWKVWRLL